MKKTQFIELYKNITKTIVSFLAILIFVLGSTALFIGLSFGSGAEKASADAQMEAVAYRDLKLIFPYGISEEEIESLLKIDGVDKTEGYNNAYAAFQIDGNSYLANVIELTDTVDLVYNIEGTIPKEIGEIAIEASFAKNSGLRIGDRISFSPDDDGTSKAIYRILNYDIENGNAKDLETKDDPDEMAYFTAREFTITALVEGAAYINTDPVAFGVNENTMQLVDCIAFVAPASLDSNAFLGYRNVLIRSDNLRGLSYFSESYATGLNQLKEAVSDMASENAHNKSRLILEKITAIKESMEKKYTDAEQKIADSEKALEGKRSTIEELRSIQKMGITDYDNIILEYDKAVKQLAEGKQSLIDSRKQIDDFIKDTAKIKEQDYVYSLSTETTNMQLILAGVEAIDKMKFSLVGMFMVICLLVCYSAISRIVNDQITVIGTKKALGLTRTEVSMSYILYTGSAALLGALIGLLIGNYILQPIVVYTATNTCVFEKIVSVFDVKVVVLLILTEVLAVVVITCFSSMAILKKTANRLLQGPEPMKGKALFFENWTLWNKLSLFSKTVVKNTIHDKRRIIGTLIGIIGCCSLIVAALTLNDNMLNSIKKQFDEYYHFDTIIMFEGDSKELEQALSNEGITTTTVTYSKITCNYPSGKTLLASVFTPDNEIAFQDLITIKVYQSDKEKAYSGIWFSNSLKNACPEEKTLNTQKMTGEKKTLNIDGFFLCHLNSPQIIMDQEAYTAYFGEQPKANALLFNRGNVDTSVLEKKVGGCDSFRSIVDFFEREQSAFKIFSILSTTMVTVFLVFSAVLAIMVLLNILTMFVQEKKRELIILMINGYTLKQARRYIYSDTILLTVLGILIGCIAGHYMGILFLGSIETDSFYLMHDIDPIAIIIGIVGCGVTCFIICLISLKQIEHFKLTDINK